MYWVTVKAYINPLRAIKAIDGHIQGQMYIKNNIYNIIMIMKIMLGVK